MSDEGNVNSGAAKQIGLLIPRSRRQQPELLQQAEGTIDEDDSDYEKDSILPVACTTSMSTLGTTSTTDQDERLGQHSGNTWKIAEILHFDKLLAEAHIRQLVENNPEKMCQLIELKFQRLEGDADDIRWQVIIN
ncbi:hypothetical protein JB92DRAFT_3130015 [Gautieria morchelliformis]|nr:hypothetical protein JB92DRAFT_3130015 [Gautieria morchelliformis]